MVPRSRKDESLWQNGSRDKRDKKAVSSRSAFLRGTEGSNPLPSTGESVVRTGDHAAFANPEMYEFLEAERISYSDCRPIPSCRTGSDTYSSARLGDAARGAPLLRQLQLSGAELEEAPINQVALYVGKFVGDCRPEVFGKAAVAIEPRKCPLDNPAARQDLETDGDHNSRRARRGVASRRNRLAEFLELALFFLTCERDHTSAG
jgi:hypothetical protein